MTNKDLEDKIREQISFAILDGQNQIHDLKDSTATPEQVTERMFKSLDYFTEKVTDLISQLENEARGCVDCKKLRCENCERLWQT